MSNRPRRRRPNRLLVDRSPSLWRRVRAFLAWFFALRVAPTAWQRKPYLRGRGRRPGKFTR